MSNLEERLIKSMSLSGTNSIKLTNSFKVDNCLNEKKCAMKTFIREFHLVQFDRKNPSVINARSD